MLKRKVAFDEPDRDCQPYARLGSIYDNDQTRHQRKRALFRLQDHNIPHWQPVKERDMPELLEYIIKHEEAFQNQYRLSSLYADFGQQLEVNPDGYKSNVAAWIKALSDAARAGVVPTQGATHDILNIRASDELAQALSHPQYGKPTCLPAVFHEAVQKKDMMPLSDFMHSKESIYSKSWIPSPWKVIQWGLRQVGVLGQPSNVSQKLAVGNFVLIKNIEVAADKILQKMAEHTSTADRVLSRADFLKRFASVLNPSAPLTVNDLNIILVYLARDKQAISYNSQTIKFKPEHESALEPVTQEDEAIANLRDTLANINAQIPPLHEKITLADAAAREAVAAKQMVRAKAALRSKKLAESALAQRTDVSLQLESVFAQLQQAADQVEIVEAMRAGAKALKSLNEKVGGAEGVQGVVDAVNEQMMVTDEISNIINETEQPLDDAEIDDEFEALEKAEKEKQEQEAAAKTAARLEELAEVEKQRNEKDEREKLRQVDEQTKNEVEVDKASESLANLSFVQPNDDKEMDDAEDEQRVRVPA